MSSKEPSIEEMTMSTTVIGLESEKKRKNELDKSAKTLKTATIPTTTIKPETSANLQKEKDERERVYLFNKIRNLLDKEVIRNQLPSDIKTPTEKASLSELRMIDGQIKSTLTAQGKKLMLAKFYDLLCDQTENIFVNFIGDKTKTNLAEFMKPLKDTAFEQEMAELESEIPDNWIPNAKVRLGAGFLMAVLSYDVRKISKMSEADESSPVENNTTPNPKQFR
jgi:hypothetical protein